MNSVKWISDNIKFKSTLYSRKTKADYDGSATDEQGYVSDNKMYALQSGFEHKSQNSENNLIFHYHNYDRDYDNAGYLDEYDSESLVVKADRSTKLSNKFHLDMVLNTNMTGVRLKIEVATLLQQKAT